MPVVDIAWAVQDLNGRSKGIQRRWDYYEGRHPSFIPQGKTLAPELRELLEDLTDNLCDDVVEEPVQRLQFLAWTAKEEKADPAQARQADAQDAPDTTPADTLGQRRAMRATELWEASKGDARAQEVHRAAWAVGDGYTIVQRDANDRLRWYEQRPECMAVRYSREDPDTIEVAAKAWLAGGKWRLNLYYPAQPEVGMDTARVERYVTKGSTNDGSVPQAKNFRLVTDADGYGEPVEALEGTRVPVFHYPADAVGRYGKPALTGTVMGLQDVLNKSVVDMVVAMEGHALPDRYGTGIQVETDPVTGRERPLFKSGRERMYRTGSKEARFGQFPQADLSGFHKTQESTRLELARKGYLPAHAVSLEAAGSAPSGISLLVAEGRLVKRVKGPGQRGFGSVWREQMAYQLTLDGLPTEPDDLEIQWAPAETRDEQALMETLAAKVALGLPKRQALLEAGYDADEVDVWLDDAQARADVIRGGSGLPELQAQGGMLPGAVPAPAGAPQPGAVAAEG